MRDRILFWLKMLVVVPWFCVACVIGLLMDFLRWGDPSNGSRYSHMLSALGLPILGIKLTVKNEERLAKNQPCVYVANHLSLVDLYIYGAVYPRNTVIIGKKEVRRIPLFGLFFAGAGNIFIDRASHDDAMKSMEQAAAYLSGKHLAVWIFVEGHRNLYPPMLPFKKGAFHLAVLAGVPIVPLVCQPYGHVIDTNKQTAPGGEVSIHVLEPIQSAGLTADELMQRVRARMDEEMAQWVKSP